jgi:hypothetical protein
METQENDVVTILFMLALLTFAVVLVDERWLRTAIAFVPAMLIVQRALGAARSRKGAESDGSASDRREDGDVRGHVEELLRHFREFYSTCHLMGTGLMAPDDAERRASDLEKELNRLLARIMDTAKKGAGVPGA